MSRRREFPTNVRFAAFLRCARRCESCTASLRPGQYRFDHVIPDALGGEPTLENCQVICKSCDSPKTSADQSRIAKMKRQRIRHLDEPRSPRPMVGSKRSGWKRTFNHGWVRRDGAEQ